MTDEHDDDLEAFANASRVPRLTLTHEHVVCRVHGEPFRASWPRGFAAFTVGAVGAVLAIPAFVAESGDDLSKATAALDRAPICARLSFAALEALYKDCGIGGLGHCGFCHGDRTGTPYTLDTGAGTVTQHVCFYCVASRRCQA